MDDTPHRAKVIAFPCGKASRNSPASTSPPTSNGLRPEAGNTPLPPRDPLTRMLESLHPRVQAVLVLRDGKWGFYERESATGRSVLATTTLPELLQILDKSSTSASVSILAQSPSVLQAPRRPQDHPTMRNQRITLSPWPHFDLALLLREGIPRYALCLHPGTSIYVAEEALPMVAEFFDTTTEPVR